MIRTVLLLILAASAGLAAPSEGQSLLAARGLGYPVPPLDARAQGVGGVPLGLPGMALSLVNPAGTAGIPAPTLVVAFRSDLYDAEYAGGSVSGSTARFPVIQVALPVGTRWTLAAGFGSFLDQNWATERTDTVSFGERRIGVDERTTVEGGVSRLRVAAAYAATDRLALGAGLDVYTGSRTGTFQRAFGTGADSLLIPPTLVIPTRYETRWRYSGMGATAGARWTALEALILAGAVSYGGTLDAEPASDSVQGGSYSLPLTMNLGASGRLTPGAVVALSGEWAGWSSADADLAASGGARDSWTLSGGVELDRAARDGSASFPLRVGARYGTLPFRWSSTAEFPTERALTAGLGARIAGGAANADLALERGWRGGEAAALEEGYWKLSFSLALLAR